MRRLLTIIALAALAGCESLAGPDAGQLTGRLDGVRWRGTATIRPGPADEPTLRSEVRTGGGARHIGVYLPAGVAAGTYTIQDDGAWYVSEPDDTVGDAYGARATGGTLVIQRVTDEEMLGSLEVSFEGPGGDVLRFTDGEFRVRLVE